MKLKVVLSVSAGASDKTVALAKSAAKGVLKTYPFASLTTETLASANSALTAFVTASAAAPAVML